MRNPAILTIIFGFYLLFVLKVGPKFMENRRAFNLKSIIAVYNVLQVLSCGLIVVGLLKNGFSFRNTWKCVKVPEEKMVAVYKIMQWVIIDRLAELVEAVFFVLRKKDIQISFLHLYHHISTIVLLWTFFKYSAGMMEIFIVVINSIVHVIMYTYYFLSSFKEMSSILRILKPFITIVQMGQFVLILGHCFVAVLPHCQATNLFYVQIPNIIMLFYLFGNFFRKSYINKKRTE
ncbi:unnamed protein product [Diamesa serratosioi]